MQVILGNVFAVATLDSNIDVHDRAYLYYRLFARNLEDARKIIAAPKVREQNTEKNLKTSKTNSSL
jgi:hypothetical protein